MSLNESTNEVAALTGFLVPSTGLRFPAASELIKDQA